MSRRNPADTIPADRRGATLAICSVAVFGAGVLWLSGSMSPVVVDHLFSDGAVAAAWVLSAAGIGGAILRLLRISCESKALKFATAAAIGLGVMSLVVLGLGLAGWLNRVVAIVIVAVGLVAGVVQMLKSAAPLAGRDLTRPGSGAAKQAIDWWWLLVMPLVAIVVVAAFVPPGILWGDEPHGYDVAEYHLQVPREWYEAGRIAPLEHNVFSYFPFNIEMHYLLAMHLCGGGWQGMYVAQLMHALFVVLTVFVILGTAKSHAAIAAAAVPWMTMLAPVAYNEGGLLLFGTLAVAWTMQSHGAMKQMTLAGAMAGFACGTKLTAVPMVLVALPAAFLVSLSLRERGGVRGAENTEAIGTRERPHPSPLPKGEGVRAIAMFVLAGLVTFSPWLVRNVVWTGNPVFPEAMSVFGRGHFSEVQMQRWEQAHSAPQQQSRAAAFGTQIVAAWRYGFVLLPLAVVAVAQNRKRETSFLAILLLMQAIVWVGFTHLQGRFFVLAIPLAAMIVGQVRWMRWPAIVATMVGTVTSVAMLMPRLTAPQLALTIGSENLRWLQQQAVEDALSSGRPVALIGEARAFWYQVPMSRLRYRTVFDVDVKPGQSVIDAWAAGAPDDAVLVVDPNELRRFANTYAGIPELQSEGAEPFVMIRPPPASAPTPASAPSP